MNYFSCLSVTFYCVLYRSMTFSYANGVNMSCELCLLGSGATADSVLGYIFVIQHKFPITIINISIRYTTMQSSRNPRQQKK